jgi:hypothetical protein
MLRRLKKDTHREQCRSLVRSVLDILLHNTGRFPCHDRKYYPSTQSQKQEHNHQYFKIDFASEKLRQDGDFVTHMICECKPDVLTIRQNEEAMETLEKVVRVCVRSEDTNFVWVRYAFETASSS